MKVDLRETPHTLAHLVVDVGTGFSPLEKKFARYIVDIHKIIRGHTDPVGVYVRGEPSHPLQTLIDGIK